MTRKTKRTQISETPVERFERVTKRVLERDRKARMRKGSQSKRKTVTTAR